MIGFACSISHLRQCQANSKGDGSVSKATSVQREPQRVEQANKTIPSPPVLDTVAARADGHPGYTSRILSNEHRGVCRDTVRDPTGLRTKFESVKICTDSTDSNLNFDEFDPLRAPVRYTLRTP